MPSSLSSAQGFNPKLYAYVFNDPCADVKSNHFESVRDVIEGKIIQGKYF